MNKKILIFAAALLLAGCQAKGETKKETETTPVIETEKPTEPTKNNKTQNTGNTENTGDTGYCFEYKNKMVSVNDDAASLLASLGEAKKETSYDSKAFVGKEKVYEYEGLRIATYPGDTKDYIGSILLTDQTLATKEGIKVGDSKETVEKAYTNNIKEGKNGILTATSGDTMIRFIIMDEKVAAIDYYPVLKNKKISNDKDAPEVVNPFELTFYTDQSEADVNACRYTSAKDSMDVNARVILDASKVDLTKCGDYTVTFYAYDRAGNSSKRKVTYTVAQKQAGYTDVDRVDQLADQVLSKIIKDNMSTTDKCAAIYNWIRSDFHFVDTSDKTDWLQTANEGLRRRSGDCFTYYATAQELLYRAGIQSMRVQKNPGYESTHYWSLVYIPDQGWYHYDTTPRKAGGVFDLVTDGWLLNYSAKNGNSHDFDTSKYPATPKTAVKK